MRISGADIATDTENIVGGNGDNETTSKTIIGRRNENTACGRPASPAQDSVNISSQIKKGNRFSLRKESA